MSVWDELIGQDEAVALFQRAVEASTRGTDDRSGMTSSWLITGPAGSGRSNCAYAFAAALLCPNGGCGSCDSCEQVRARTHPDLTAIATETLLLDIKTARSLVDRASMQPMHARYRVIVVEDADRMIARTSNTLLKAIEEPPATTVWLLCAPSEADLLPTIRSRVRTVSLKVPSVADVAALLAARDGIPADLAERAARLAQSHIGMARRLATAPEVAQRREQALNGVLQLSSTGAAVRKAAEWVELAQADGEAQSADRDARERDELLHSMGVPKGQAVPKQMRSLVRDLEEHQKRRAKRAHLDGIDRILTDLQSLLRDLLTVQLDMGAPLVNAEREDELNSVARGRNPASTLTSIDAIATARARLAANVPPALALEALAIDLMPRP